MELFSFRLILFFSGSFEIIIGYQSRRRKSLRKMRIENLLHGAVMGDFFLLKIRMKKFKQVGEAFKRNIDRYLHGLMT